uniref:28S ribosomal protein S14, mitochondrial n=1 Tax=Lygus hesperus TaxID=30085 RepID=A0A0A9X4R2_LYGHE
MLRNPFSQLFSKWSSSITQNTQTQVRYKWTDWRMAKDVRKRKTLAEHAVQKLRINALRKNDILPKEIREIADLQIQELPRDAVGIRIRGRCAITSRPRGNVLRWRVSRIIFRSLADYNKLAGVQRAMW